MLNGKFNGMEEFNGKSGIPEEGKFGDFEKIEFLDESPEKIKIYFTNIEIVISKIKPEYNEKLFNALKESLRELASTSGGRSRRSKRSKRSRRSRKSRKSRRKRK
jgi:hypothetical protein